MFKLGAATRSEAGGGANLIYNLFEIGKQVSVAGPAGCWKVYEAHRKSDAKEVSVLIFDKKSAEKLYKPKKRDAICECLRNGVKQLERNRHPRILQVVHSVEECPETMAFATEPILACLANILTPAEDPSQVSFSRDYNFLDIELKYGLLQIIEALSFLHYTVHMVHRNVCPFSVFVTKRGTWKLGGMEFAERINGEVSDSIECSPWSSRLPRQSQPDLDFVAPEVQSGSRCGLHSDMFSLGLLICSLFNAGRSLIEATHNTTTYNRHCDHLSESVKQLLHKIPVALQEAVVRLLNRDARQRPTAQLLSLIKYFSDPAVSALQFLDVISMKDPSQKSNFFRSTLPEMLPFIPRKLWFQHVWPCLREEMMAQEVLAAVLQPILFIVGEICDDEYQTIILPRFRCIFAWPKSIQATVTLLENLHIILEKTPADEIRTDLLPLVYCALDNSTVQIQRASLLAIPNVADYIDDEAARKIVFPRARSIYEKNSSDLLITLYMLLAVQTILHKLERKAILEELLPLMLDIRLQDPDLIQATVNIYRTLLSEPKRYAFSVNLIATRVMPALLPLTMNAALHLDQFVSLLELLQAMLDSIDRTQRNKLKLEDMAASGCGEIRRPSELRHHTSSDNMMARMHSAVSTAHTAATARGGATVAPPFHIPNLRVEQRRKTSSAEDCSRKSTGSVGSLFGGGGGSPDGHLLRVHSALAGRRLSDNQLLNPPKIRVGSFSASSSAADLSAGGLPIRRHSSTGPTDSRRTSILNLSPPSLYQRYGWHTGSAPGTASWLSPASGGSLSRRQSAANISGLAISGLGSKRGSCVSVSGSQQASGLLQQLSSGMVSRYGTLSGRRWPGSVSLTPLQPTSVAAGLAGSGGYASRRSSSMRTVPTIQRQMMY